MGFLNYLGIAYLLKKVFRKKTLPTDFTNTCITSSRPDYNPERFTHLDDIELLRDDLDDIEDQYGNYNDFDDYDHYDECDDFDDFDDYDF